MVEINKLEKYTPCGEVSPATAKLLLMMLREITDERDMIIIPQRKIAKAIGMSKSAVSRNLRRLERAGVLEIQAVYGRFGGRLPNNYILKRGAKNG